LGNTTNAVTAAWREMLDNGMYANFPGFLVAKGGSRQNTNIFRVPPGGGAQIDTSGVPINQAVMPLPYETAHMAPMMQLVDNMVSTGQRVGGTSEMQVGEGRAEAPVGTTMALIDQAVKVMSAVHKRIHAAQAKELQMIVSVFKEHPESFWQRGCKSQTKWDEARFNQAVNNCELVPQSDPNTASTGQRAMKIMGLKQLQQQNGALYDPIAVDSAALRAMGWSNPEEFFVPKAARAAPPTQLQQMQAQLQNESKAADAKVTEANARATEAQAREAEAQEKIKTGHFVPKQSASGVAAPEQETSLDVATATAKLMDAQTKQREVAVREMEAKTEDENRDKDRTDRMRESAIGLAGEVIRAPTAGESGKQVAVDKIGHKTRKIIADVDKGLD
jgi:hypothetical protein